MTGASQSTPPTRHTPPPPLGTEISSLLQWCGVGYLMCSVVLCRKTLWKSFLLVFSSLVGLYLKLKFVWLVRHRHQSRHHCPLPSSSPSSHHHQRHCRCHCRCSLCRFLAAHFGLHPFLVRHQKPLRSRLFPWQILLSSHLNRNKDHDEMIL